MNENDGLFELEDWMRLGAAPDQTTASKPGAGKNEAQKSISYVLDAVLRYGKVGGYADVLDRVARTCSLSGYSPYNALLIMLQRPAATFVLPAHRRQDTYGYVVQPGEQPMVLLQPGGPVMFLLDVSQVEPGPNAIALPPEFANPHRLPHVPDAEETLHWITQNAKIDGVRVSPAPLALGFGGCVSPSEGAAHQQVIVRKRPQKLEKVVAVRHDVNLNRSYSATEKLAIMAHELGHVYCGHLSADIEGHWKDRSELDVEIKELEAHSVARMVFKSFASDVSLPDHLRQYFTEEPELAGISLEAVLKATGRVLDIASGWGPQCKTGGKTAKA